MSRFVSESLDAPHTQRELDQIPVSAPSAEKMAEAALARAGLVKRLRVTGNPQNHDPRSLLADYAVSRLEAANALEQLERYLRLEQNNNVKISREIERINTELAAEKALADSYADGFRIGKSGGVIMRPAKVKAANAAYRKARGL